VTFVTSKQFICVLLTPLGVRALALPEVDNCPVCGRECVLDINFFSDDEDQLGSDLGVEFAYANCKTCKTKWRRKVDLDKALKSYEKWVVQVPKQNIGHWAKIKENQIRVGKL
jgi:hypothetical protein